VALRDDGRTIDRAETDRLRADRFPSKLFHRGEYHDATA
jgi:hypothetical protein